MRTPAASPPELKPAAARALALKAAPVPRTETNPAVTAVPVTTAKAATLTQAPTIPETTVMAVAPTETNSPPGPRPTQSVTPIRESLVGISYGHVVENA